jgi:hypothetical protein
VPKGKEMVVAPKLPVTSKKEVKKLRRGEGRGKRPYDTRRIPYPKKLLT